MLGRRRERFLEGYEFPQGLEAKLAAARPELRATDRALVMEGLRDWFRMPLPSPAVPRDALARSG